MDLNKWGPLRLEQIDDRPMSTSLKSQQAWGTRTTAMHADRFRPCARVNRQEAEYDHVLRGTISSNDGASEASIGPAFLHRRLPSPVNERRSRARKLSREARRAILAQLQRLLDDLLPRQSLISCHSQH